MGASSSKAARSAPRRYPSRAPGSAVPHSAPPRTQQPPQQQQQSTPNQTEPFGSKNQAIHEDGSDPEFARRLQQMGIVQPNPTYSPSSTASSSQQPATTLNNGGSINSHSNDGILQSFGPVFPASRINSTLHVLEARRKIEHLAEEDFEAMGRASHSGRQFIDMRTLVDVMQLLNRGLSRSQVEKQLKLQPNLLSKLGPAGVFTHIASDKAPKVDQCMSAVKFHRVGGETALEGIVKMASYIEFEGIVQVPG